MCSPAGIIPRRSLSLLVLAVVLAFGCKGTPEGGYPAEEGYPAACGMIGAMRFDEADALLAGIDPLTVRKWDPATARHLCRVGQLASQGKFDEAFGRMIEVREDGRYVVVVHPDDPLHRPALNLALWIKVTQYEKRIKELLAMDPETEEFGLALTGLQPTAYAEEVLKYSLPEYEANEYYIGGDYSLPRIMFASFVNVKLLWAYEKVLAGAQKRFRDYLPRPRRHEELYMAYFADR